LSSIAALLTLGGICSVLSLAVAARRRELATRSAIGAERGRLRAERARLRLRASPAARHHRPRIRRRFQRRLGANQNAQIFYLDARTARTVIEPDDG
jgi:hypothetical protein